MTVKAIEEVEIFTEEVNTSDLIPDGDLIIEGLRETVTPHEVFEIRALHARTSENEQPRTWSGFFWGHELLEMRRSLLQVQQHCKGVYIVPNPIDPK